MHVVHYLTCLRVITSARMWQSDPHSVMQMTTFIAGINMSYDLSEYMSESRQPDLEVTCLNINKLKLYNTCILPIFLYGSDCGQSWGQMHDRCFWSVVSMNAARYHMAPICSKWRGLEANRTMQTDCNSPVTTPDPFWAHCTYGRQHRCHEDPVNSPSWGLETLRTSPHHMAEHHTAGSEIPQSHTAWSTGYGPELVSVEDVVDVWRYAILSCMPETMAMTDMSAQQMPRLTHVMLPPLTLLLRQQQQFVLVPLNCPHSTTLMLSITMVNKLSCYLHSQTCHITVL